MTLRNASLRKFAVALFVVSWLPLLLYIPFDALRGGGGNPIGLGLLMVAGTFVSGTLLLLDTVRRAIGARTRRDEPS